MQVTNDITDLSEAELFSEVGKQVNLLPLTSDGVPQRAETQRAWPVQCCTAYSVPNMHASPYCRRLLRSAFRWSRTQPARQRACETPAAWR